MSFVIARIRLLVAVAAVAPLAGCVSADYRHPQVSVPSTFTSDDGTVDAAALDKSWQLFGDKQLNALIEEALARAPDAKTALAVLEEAKATRAEALSKFGVQGNANAGASFQSTTISTVPGAIREGVFSGAFSPSWELDLFGRRPAARRAANADLDAARFLFEATRQSLASNVAGDLFEARGLTVSLDQARETLRIAVDLAQVGSRRVDAGIGSRADAASLDADAATARAVVRSLESQLEISKRTLLVLLGRGTEPVETLAITGDLGAPPPIPAATPATLLVRRPDIRQAEARMRSAAGNLKLDSLSLLPTINLLPSASYSRGTGASATTSSLWSLGAGLLVPIFDRARLLAEVRGQRARTEQAVIAYENAVQSGFAEAQNNLSLYAADRDRLAQLDLAEERSRFAFNAQNAGYKAGIVDLTTLLQAERTWRGNLSALSDLRSTTLRDAVNVFRALGGGWPATATAGAMSESNDGGMK